MTSAVVPVLRFWEAAIERREEDPSVIADVLDAKIEVHDFDLPDAGVYHGLDGLVRWLADWAEPWEEWGGQLRDLLDLGDEVVSLTHIHARASGLEIERHDSQLITVRDGRIAKLEYYGQAETAIERAADPQKAAARKRAHDTIRAFNDAFARRDIEAAVSFIGDDYEFHPEGDSPLAVNVYRGPEGVRRYFEHAHEIWQHVEIRIERLVDAGEQIVALYQLDARARGSGIELSERWAELYQVEGEELASSRLFTSHDEALAAAGLAT